MIITANDYKATKRQINPRSIYVYYSRYGNSVDIYRDRGQVMTIRFRRRYWVERLINMMVSANNNWYVERGQADANKAARAD